MLLVLNLLKVKLCDFECYILYVLYMYIIFFELKVVK